MILCFYPSLLSVRGLVWFLAIGNVNQACRSDPEQHSVLPLFALWLSCATYVFSDAWQLFCTAVIHYLLVSPAASLRHCLTYQKRESNIQVSCLAWEAWQVLRSLVTRERGGNEPVAVQLSEKTGLGLFRKQRILTLEGRAALPKHLHLLPPFQG